MLKGIPSIISPQLLKVLMEMGHGDEIVLADGNFPVASHAHLEVRADGHAMVPLLHAILTLLPLDAYVLHPAALMQVVSGDSARTPIWSEYATAIERYAGMTDPFEYVDRFSFYERARKAHAIVATGERALYANIILKKGVIVEV